jgi:hypothetical protein
MRRLQNCGGRALEIKSRQEDIGSCESSNLARHAVCRAASGVIDRTEACRFANDRSSQGSGSRLTGEKKQTGDAMPSPQVATGDRIVDPLIALAGCSTRQRILVAGSKSMELMLELHRRGYLLATAAGNCGRPTGQYDVALVDWRRRTLHALEPTMDWLMNFLSPRAVLVVWVDAQKPAANDSLRTSVTKRGFAIVRGAVHECGCALLARRSQDYPVQKAA